jgi:hypothetical protein
MSTPRNQPIDVQLQILRRLTDEDLGRAEKSKVFSPEAIKIEYKKRFRHHVSKLTNQELLNKLKPEGYIRISAESRFLFHKLNTEHRSVESIQNTIKALNSVYDDEIIEDLAIWLDERYYANSDGDENVNFKYVLSLPKESIIEISSKVVNISDIEKFVAKIKKDQNSIDLKVLKKMFRAMFGKFDIDSDRFQI